MSQQSSHSPASVTWLGPEPEQKEKLDTLPSEKQPPGIDEDDDFPQSLEEALVG